MKDVVYTTPKQGIDVELRDKVENRRKCEQLITGTRAEWQKFP
jgi:hypothetical protein